MRFNKSNQDKTKHCPLTFQRPVVVLALWFPPPPDGLRIIMTGKKLD